MTRMAPRILFVILSSRRATGAVEQLVDMLSPHQVVIHHDFSKAADFRVDRPNARLIPDPCLTGWGTWGLCEAIVHSIRFGLDNCEFDYLQLLSEACLPIRPLREFEEHVAGGDADANADIIDIESDPDTWMTYASRAYLPAGSLRYRVAQRLRSWYFGDDAQWVERQSLVVLRPPGDGQVCSSLRRKAALSITRAMCARPFCAHAYSADFRPAVGSTWFGARREVCEYLVARAHEPRLRAFFARQAIPDEQFLQTILRNSHFRLGRSNHAISRFSRSGHTQLIRPDELERMFASGRFFARKFPDDPAAPSRLSAIERASSR